MYRCWWSCRFNSFQRSTCMIKDPYVDITRRRCFLEYAVIHVCNVGFVNNELITKYHTIFTTLFEKWITNMCLTSESQVVCYEMKNEQHVRNRSWYIGWVHPDHVFAPGVITTCFNKGWIKNWALCNYMNIWYHICSDGNFSQFFMFLLNIM